MAAMIGIVGGVGPYAGLDLAKKVMDNTRAGLDQEHIPLKLISSPHLIADRTEFLEGRIAENPAFALAELLRALERSGATVAGIPCNTAHAPRIFDIIEVELRRQGSNIHVLHMIREVAKYVGEQLPHSRKIGVLSTTGTWASGLYLHELERIGKVVQRPEAEAQEQVHASIYHPDWGIKAQSNPISEFSREILLRESRALLDRGAETIILGCTEISLFHAQIGNQEIPGIDPTEILARALIRETMPQKLL